MVKTFLDFADGSAELELELSDAQSRYCIAKGSIAVNGISLTIANVKHNIVKIALIPLTLKHTNIASFKRGSFVNIECDMMGKYIEKLIHPYLERNGEAEGDFFSTHNTIDGAA